MSVRRDAGPQPKAYCQKCGRGVDSLPHEVSRFKKVFRFCSEVCQDAFRATHQRYEDWYEVSDRGYQSARDRGHITV